MGTKIDKKPKFFKVSMFLCNLLSKFRQTSWIAVLKTIIKERIRCPVVFYGEIIAVS